MACRTRGRVREPRLLVDVNEFAEAIEQSPSHLKTGRHALLDANRTTSPDHVALEPGARRRHPSGIAKGHGEMSLGGRSRPLVGLAEREGFADRGLARRVVPGQEMF